jgi:hypothetical protein
MFELKKIGNVFMSKFVGTGPSSYKKIIYRAAVSQRLRNTALVSSPMFKSMWGCCFLSFIGHPLWLKSGPIHVWSLCWLYLCSLYRELNIIYTTHYTCISALANLWRAERYPWQAVFTAIPICFIYILPDQHLYTVENMCIYTHIWLRTDCMWITFATK